MTQLKPYNSQKYKIFPIYKKPHYNHHIEIAKNKYISWMWDRKEKLTLSTLKCNNFRRIRIFRML